MRMVFSGLAKTMLKMWTNTTLPDKSRFKQSDDALVLISERLVRACEFHPDELTSRGLLNQPSSNFGVINFGYNYTSSQNFSSIGQLAGI